MSERGFAVLRQRPSPRIAGRRLQVLARLCRSPGVGRRLSELVLREMGLLAFRDTPEPGPVKPAIKFRVEARPPAREKSDA